MVAYDRVDLNSLAFAKCACSRDFLRSSLRIASKVNQSGWAIISHDLAFQNAPPDPSMEPGNKVEVPHQADMRKKSLGVSASIGEENRWQSNSLQSAYKIARCVAG